MTRGLDENEELIAESDKWTQMVTKSATVGFRSKSKNSLKNWATVESVRNRLFVPTTWLSLSQNILSQNILSQKVVL